MSEKLSILVVEDDLAELRFLRAMLARGADPPALTETARLEDAIVHLREKAFSLVLLDLGLPDAFGVGIVGRVREAAPDTPIIVITGTLSEDDGKDAIANGADDYLMKGNFDLKALSHAMRYAIERKRGEAQRRLLTQELARSNAELGRFAQAASHDLKAPLRKVSALADFLSTRATGLDEESKDLLHRMRAAVAHMDGLIETLLELGRVRTATRPMARVDLTAVVNAVVSDNKDSIEKINGRVVVSALPPLNADEIQMRQLFQNLITNALKFRSTQSAPLVEVAGRLQPNGGTEVIVHDNGIGFDPEYAEKIFEPFVRLHTPEKYEGNGIGLAICDSIMRHHGGRIAAKSAPGAGATFTLTFPPPLGK